MEDASSEVSEETNGETTAEAEEETESVEPPELSEVEDSEGEPTMFPQTPDDPVTLKFEGLDLSDLTPESDSGNQEYESAEDEEPVDLWSINDGANEEGASNGDLEIFENLGSSDQGEEDSGAEIDIDLDMTDGDAEPEGDQPKAEDGDEEALDLDKNEK